MENNPIITYLELSKDLTAKIIQLFKADTNVKELKEGDVVTMIHQSFNIEFLEKAYPNAAFVLNDLGVNALTLKLKFLQVQVFTISLDQYYEE